MIFLVFPKRFEMLNFILRCYLEKKVLFLFKDNEIDDMYLVRLELSLGDDTFHVFVYCVFLEQSDISFNLAFHEKLRVILTTKQKIKMCDVYCILCGTCGADSSSFDIGDTVFIKEAIKFDRGFIDADFKVDLSMSKFLRLSTALVTENNFSEAIALSSNYISHLSTEAFQAKFGITSPCVFEMETFDFFSVCHLNDIRHFAAFRIVSDSFNDKTEEIRSLDLLNHFAATKDIKIRLWANKQKQDFPEEIKRLNRKLLDMSNLVAALEKVLPQVAITVSKSIKNTKYLKGDKFGDYFVQREVNSDVSNVYKFPIKRDAVLDEHINYGVESSIKLLTKSYWPEFERLVRELKSISIRFDDIKPEREDQLYSSHVDLHQQQKPVEDEPGQAPKRPAGSSAKKKPKKKSKKKE